jgi:hypothetical protein
MVRSFLRTTVAGLVIAGIAATAALAESGGVPDEDELDRQGLERRSVAKEGYMALSEAAFVLLFEVRAGDFGSWGGADNPRGVNFLNAPSSDALHWALQMSREYSTRVRNEQIKELNAGSKREAQNSDTELPDTGVFIQAIDLDEPGLSEFHAWAGKRGTLVKPVQIYLRGLLNVPQIAAPAPEEKSEGSIFGQILGDAVKAIEDVADTNIVFENAAKDDGGTQAAGAAFSFGVSYWDSRNWQKSEWAQEPPFYTGALDAVVGWHKVPEWGLGLEVDYRSIDIAIDTGRFQAGTGGRTVANDRADSGSSVKDGSIQFPIAERSLELDIDINPLYWVRGPDFITGAASDSDFRLSSAIKYNW